VLDEIGTLTQRVDAVQEVERGPVEGGHVRGVALEKESVSSSMVHQGGGESSV